MTRLARSGRGVPFSLSRRSVVKVTIKQMHHSSPCAPSSCGCRRRRAATSSGSARRLPGGRRLHAGRYRIGLAVLDDATRKPGPAAALVVRLLPS